MDDCDDVTASTEVAQESRESRWADALFAVRGRAG